MRAGSKAVDRNATVCAESRIITPIHTPRKGQTAAGSEIICSSKTERGGRLINLTVGTSSNFALRRRIIDKDRTACVTTVSGPVGSCCRYRCRTIVQRSGIPES